MNSFEVKNMSEADEVRRMPKTKGEIVKVGNHTVMRGTFDAGWKWSDCVKPIVGGQSCQATHLIYIISGKMVVRMDNGTQSEVGPGDTIFVPPGHDAWVLGDEPCVSIDFTAGETYGKK